MRRVPAISALLIVLLFFVLVGAVAARVQERKAQAVQPGWCCLEGQTRCSVEQNLDACQQAGGSVFNWSQQACDALCQP